VRLTMQEADYTSNRSYRMAGDIMAYIRMGSSCKMFDAFILGLYLLIDLFIAGICNRIGSTTRTTLRRGGPRRQDLSFAQPVVQLGTVI
jgi:hypothetical protein